MPEKTRVIVVGAGPVGLVTALRLVRAGLSVRVIEAAHELHAEPRASTFHPPTLELLATLGLAEPLIARGRPAPEWQYRMFESGEAAVFDMGVLGDETPFPFRLQCEQFNLVALAADRLAEEAPGTICFGMRATAVRQTADEAIVAVDHDGIAGHLGADWVIGCDGASSIVRTSLGLTFEGDTYAAPNVTVGTAFDFTGRLPGLLNVNYFWSAFGSFSMFHTKDMWRLGFSPPPEMSEAEAASADAVENMLQRILPQPARYPITTARLYRIHKRIASRFQLGRILLAGDAAHLNSPSGGYGMNGGVQDAFALTDALLRTLETGDWHHLDRYTRQRRSAALEDIQQTSDANHRRHREADPARRQAALAELQAIAADRDRLKGFLMQSSLIESWRRSQAVA